MYNIQYLFFGNNYILFDRKKQFALHAAQEYPIFVQQLQDELSHFKFNSAFKWDDSSFNEILYMLLIHWTDLTRELEKALVPIKIGIFFDYDIEHSEFLKSLIYFHFDKHVNIHILISLTEEQAYIESENYDLIITDLSHLQLLAKKVICINSIPSAHDWKNIQNEIMSQNKNPLLITTKFLNLDD